MPERFPLHLLIEDSYAAPTRLCCGRGVAMLLLLFVAAMSASGIAAAQDLDLNPTRPTVANAASIQGKGVLQVEAGYDAYPQVVPGDQQTAALSVFYAPLERLRLDFGWSAFNYEAGDGMATAKGVGTIQAGAKVVVAPERYGHILPGLAVQYEATLPTASNETLQDKGQQFIVLLNHHYGKDGVLDVIVNGSLVQWSCADAGGCRYGGQQAVAVSYHISKPTRLYAEVFAQNNNQSDTPAGTYAFGGFYHKFTESFGLDGGVRFGLSDHSATVGTTIGVVYARRLHHD